MISPDFDSAREAADVFGFSSTVKMTSLCRYAPVYRLQANNIDLVLKRTGYPRSSAHSIAGWLRSLRSRGVDVVAPVANFEPNPRHVRPTDKWWWVLYPFVRGHVYKGSISEVGGAGRLLGKIHAEGLEHGLDMERRNKLSVPDYAVIGERLEKSIGYMKRFEPGVLNIFRRNADHIIELAYSRSSSEDGLLPMSACSWDFKASNLIFSIDDVPTLVDPDHAGRIPRIYDAAIAVLLFHCDLSPSPGKILNVEQWQEFYKAYSSISAWSQIELTKWVEALAAAWLDEALWLLSHFPDGWEREDERRYLLDLALVDLGIFSIP